MNQSNTIKKFSIVSLAILCCSVLVLELLHLHNGFPILLGDSHAYIAMGLDFRENSHWSNMYSYFVGKHIQLFSTVNWIPFSQNLIVAVVLFLLTRHAFSYRNNLKFLAIISTLIFSSLPWISSMLMSDIATPICLLVVLMIIHYRLRLASYILLSFLFLAMASWHQSHLVIIPLFILSVICIKMLFMDGKVTHRILTITKRVLPFIMLFVVSFWLEKNIFNGSKLNQPKTQKEKVTSTTTDITSGYYFVGIRMWEVGEIDNLLESFCPDHPDNYLCDPDNPNEEKVRIPSFLRRNPDNEDYQKFSNDNKQFVLGCLKIPRFYYALTKAVITRSPQLLKQTEIRQYGIYNGKTLHKNLNRISPLEKRKLLDSNQVNGYYIGAFYEKYLLLDKFWWFIVLPAVLFFTFYTKYQNKSTSILSKDQWMVMIILPLAHIINTVVCGTFSNTENLRYSSRTIWLVNLAIILLLIFVIEARRKFQSSHHEVNRTDTMSQ